MYYYFSSINTCYVKLNGVFFGKLSPTAKPINVELANPVIEILPIDGLGTNLNFALNEDFLLSPPDFAVVTDLKGGYLIKILNYEIKSGFNLICQQKTNSCLLTAYNDFGTKLSFESKNGFNIVNINCVFFDVKISTIQSNGENYFAVDFIGNKHSFYVFSSDGTQLLFKEADFINVNSTIYLEIEHNDVLKHVEKTEYKIENGNVVEISRILKTKKEYSPFLFNEKIIPYIFLENLLVGDAVIPFISEELTSSDKTVKDYFNGVLGVFPPPSFRNSNEVGLLFLKDKNLYEVKYATFEMQDKKITNFKILDD